MKRLIVVTIMFAFTGMSTFSYAQRCKGLPKFSDWAESFRKEARQAGISSSTINLASKQFGYEKSIIRKDRNQGIFSKNFLQFSDLVVTQSRINKGRQKLRQMKLVFARIERQFGVPGAVISAFWGLETDFGANSGSELTIRSLSTLAYDCRRPKKFRHQLMDALRILDRGDLKISQMVGGWAGELGHTQFLPSEYNAFAVDFDGDGKRNLVTSEADALASSANLLKKLGWRREEPWLQEVRIPEKMRWEEADLDIKLPRTEWEERGVKYADNSAIPADHMKASLLLPVGRKGPAFLAYHNFDIFLEWNHSLVYSTTAAYFAIRLAGAEKAWRGGKISSLGYKQIRQLQRKLVKLGLDVGKIDGIIGKKTRAAVKIIQKKLGLPADSYPTKELLDHAHFG